MVKVNKPDKLISADVVLIGAGIMSATLGLFLKKLQPNWNIVILEKLAEPALESSNVFNNAGTGHSANCEFNYTPRNIAGDIDITKAVKVAEKFKYSLQFWSYLTEAGVIKDPSNFINRIPHIGFVTGLDGVSFLKKRYEAMRKNPLFSSMEFSDRFDKFAEKVPLMAEGRNAEDALAFTWVDSGTDVNFEVLTKQYLAYLAKTEVIYFNQKVVNIQKDDAKNWIITAKNTMDKSSLKVKGKFVFVGAGGEALSLLQKSKIPEIQRWGGFPVSGEFLICQNSEITNLHHAKVYGRAATGAPPMSVPHLDTRIIEGKKYLLFGPFAGWTPKFTKFGSYFDLFKTIKSNNITSYLGVGLREFSLTAYLVKELLKNQSKRIADLRKFMPKADAEDWNLQVAGQRVQTIKPKGRSGTLEFGTLTLKTKDGTLAGLLGASPGASTAPYEMLSLLTSCFPNKITEWLPKIKDFIPSYGRSFEQDKKLLTEINNWTTKTLKLN